MLNSVTSSPKLSNLVIGLWCKRFAICIRNNQRWSCAWLYYWKRYHVRFCVVVLAIPANDHSHRTRWYSL